MERLELSEEVDWPVKPKVYEGQLWLAEHTRHAPVLLLVLSVVKSRQSRFEFTVNLVVLLNDTTVDDVFASAGSTMILKLRVHELQQDFRLLSNVDKTRHCSMPTLSEQYTRALLVQELMQRRY